MKIVQSQHNENLNLNINDDVELLVGDEKKNDKELDNTLSISEIMLEL